MMKNKKYVIQTLDGGQWKDFTVFQWHEFDAARTVIAGHSFLLAKKPGSGPNVRCIERTEKFLFDSSTPF
jgi:hypothetical protein